MSGHTRKSCAEKCIDWGPECLGIEWLTEDVGTFFEKGGTFFEKGDHIYYV